MVRWIAKYYLVRFENTNQARIPELIAYLDQHPKRASTASRFNSSATTVGIYFRCRQSQLSGIIDNVEASVSDTRFKTHYDAGYITPQQKENFYKAIKSLKLPVIVYFSTLASDSGITSWIMRVDLLSPTSNPVEEFIPILVKGALVAIVPTIAAVVAVTKKSMGQ